MLMCFYFISVCLGKPLGYFLFFFPPRVRWFDPYFKKISWCLMEDSPGWLSWGGVVMTDKEAALVIAMWVTDDEKLHQGSSHGIRGGGTNEITGRLAVFTWWCFGGLGRDAQRTSVKTSCFIWAIRWISKLCIKRRSSTVQLKRVKPQGTAKA